MSERTIRTTCTRDCPNACGLLATVEDGRLTALRGDPAHPLTRGAACAKAARYVKRVYDPERIARPMIREGGDWRRASWDEALDLVAARMKAVIRESGPEAILYYQGYGERTALKLLNKYFFNLLGGATTLCGSLCGGTGQASQNLDLGTRVSHDPLDHENSAAMILWGRNPVSTNISLAAIARRIRKRGGKVILIDPARSRSAALADHHIAPRPGRDVYLAMAAAKLLLAAGLEDRDFLENHSTGFADYRRILDAYDLDDLCGRGGVSLDEAELLAATLAEGKPASILLGWGLHRHEYAHYSIRAIDALSAISGNIGVPGGGVSQGFEEYGPYDQSFWGDGLNPPRRTLLLPRIGEEILRAKDPEIRMIYVTAANPACMAPNSAKVVQGFKKAEFTVYSGHFMDDTADLADVFLPATTFLEETDVMAGYGHNYVGPVNRAIAPVGECKSEYRMFYELASRFPFAERFRRDEDAWLADICAPIRKEGCDLATLKKGALRLNAPMVPYADKVFPTPSGRFQFLEEFDPSRLPDPDPAYPFKLLTIAPHGHICSERTVADHAPLPVVRMDAKEAAGRGLSDGGHVLVKSPSGEARALLKTERGMRPDILAAERGGWEKAGHGLNRLTRDVASAVGRGTPYYETSVTVVPCPDDGLSGTRVLVARTALRSSGGEFVKELVRLGADIVTITPGKGDDFPASCEGFGALVVLDGPHGPCDDEASPHFPALMRLMLAFDAAGKPVAGIGPGCRLLARAHGGGNRGVTEKNFGFAELAPTAAGRRDPVFGAALPMPRLLACGEDALILPENAALLAESDAGAAPCFKTGAASYGFLARLEADADIASGEMARFRARDAKAHASFRERRDDAFFEDLAAELPLLLAQSRGFCRRIARSWLELAGRKTRPSAGLPLKARRGA